MNLYQIDCDDCKDTGLLYMREDNHAPVVFMRCHCSHGLKHDSKIPRWEKELLGIFEKLPFNVKEWVPSKSTGTFDQLTEIWKAKKQFSREYWAERAKQA